MSGDHSHHHALNDRQRNEAAVYDARAAEMLSAVSADVLRVDPDAPPYPNREHVDFLDYALGRIGPLAGKKVLEIGCGTGALSVYLALQGADVVGLDVSESSLEVARARSEQAGISANAAFLLMPVENLDHPDRHYDAVIGNQVLHHLELDRAMTNVQRMLAPGGVAVFCEPVLFLPEWARRFRNSRLLTRVFPTRADTPDERSLGKAELHSILAEFRRGEWRPFQIFCRVQNFFELSDRAFSILEAVDRWVLGSIPAAKTLCRYVVVVLQAESDESVEEAMTG